MASDGGWRDPGTVQLRGWTVELSTRDPELLAAHSHWVCSDEEAEQRPPWATAAMALASIGSATAEEVAAGGGAVAAARCAHPVQVTRLERRRRQARPWRRERRRGHSASTMQHLAIFLVFLLSSALALPTPARLWSKGNGRIIGGSSANIANYPWQLSFQYGGSHICGASIISSNWALTAAHCVDGIILSLISFRAGTSTRGSGGFVRSASSGYMHASYNDQTIDYDVAVVQVSGSLLGSNAQAVGLASDNYDPPGGLAVTVTGWGATYTDGPSANSLLKVDISILDRNTCRNTFANINTVTDRMVCAGQAGKSVCSGDSGGPPVSGSTQVGIVSWGSSRCEATPGVFANVGNLRSWIRSASGV
ncbi:trypsin delta-like [Schistocerca americana]|uniref:trypsin delta-like n=1 Tax=Schistocerca americana TaxID=7009 RepID=UPI001F4F8695|nr:trypsin delta-like [Schistocerca americana]